QGHDEQAIDVKNNSSWERVAYVDSLAQTLAGEIGQPRLPVFSRGSGRRRVALLVINQIERPRNRLIPIFRANPDMKGRTANLTNVNINGRMEGVERIIVTQPCVVRVKHSKCSIHILVVGDEIHPRKSRSSYHPPDRFRRHGGGITETIFAVSPDAQIDTATYRQIFINLILIQWR